MNQLASLLEAGVLGAIDFFFAQSMGRVGEESRESVLVAAALASRAVQNGHVCLELQTVAGSTIWSPEALPESADVSVPPPEVVLPEYERWIEDLHSSPLVSRSLDSEGCTPLVLDEAGRLYLFRYAQYQDRLARRISQRLTRSPKVNSQLLRAGLRRLFPNGSCEPLSDMQRLGTISATVSYFSVISGGPGTGKTYTVSKVLVLLAEQFRSQHGGSPPRLLLLAPTGKAAQRLGESIAATAIGLDCGEEIRADIEQTATTIHRALGFQPRSPTQFRHNAENPLPADIVLVDEASMVDIALLTKLLDALPNSARLILLGDKDQLASVEAGAILGDIYGSAPEHSETFLDYVRQLLSTNVAPVDSPAIRLGDGMAHLTESRRYDRKSGIGALAVAVNAGDADEALNALAGSMDIRLLSPVAESVTPGGYPIPHPSIGEELKGHFSDFLELGPREKLERLGTLRILVAHNRGGLGTQHLNRYAEEILSDHHLLRTDTHWYRGRPILITDNDHQLGLFNGDTGVIDRNPKTGALEAFFLNAVDELISFSPARLPPHVTVFAMTVHKSQGSEFERVLLILPEQASPVLTRELIYTGITRARRDVTVYSSEEIFRVAVQRRVVRASGLREALWRAADRA